ncbi:hypothetical protein CRV08_01460 [Halarcobacter ebronensis]|uniref:Prokaryotic metallothionein n=1 Tax=Halarcobacter ebronensis TaxID=1462615 RepID=A0A4V1LS29_9BACT|nr:PP0621 family protein [Halarcobacter ebronensis]QKF82004.1 hypothetical protein AEBR_1517 [Halarcobacter ebronensis]RXJ70258.1 hypothetical protein CRV08_01460 [Halarcobacter ebronensis]RXK04284.1 hypothetical protein CRV07_10965 [Halarcobacter ebronensis]
MIIKVVSIIAVIFLVYLIFFKKNRESDVKKEDDKIEDIMVECPTCGTYVSKKEGILSNGKYYCSKECLNK